jgi:hypothetical protein
MAMKSLTIRLPRRLIASIEAEAREGKLSKSDVVRGRLEKSSVPRAPSGIWADALEILDEGWSAGAPARPPAFRSPKKQRLAELIRAKKLHR